MNAKITNNTSYNITLVDGTILKCYDTVTVSISNDTIKEQIKNLAKRGSIIVSYF